MQPLENPESIPSASIPSNDSIPSDASWAAGATVAELGEQGLLSLIRPYCQPGSVGDDAAVLPWKDGSRLVVTTDVLVDGVHFSDRTTPAHAVGWRAAAANLSDLAAMGATGQAITVALALPSQCPVAWVAGVYQGLRDCLAPYNMAIVGGDLSRSNTRSLAITALGEAAPQRTIYRHGAQPGDAIVVTGNHGSARAGLALLLQEVDPKGLSPEQQQHLIQAHRYPRPRLDCVPHLPSVGDRTHISGMDSSDGLADALWQICRASQVGAVIQADTIPIDPALAQWQPERSLPWSLYGGEDFELVLCLPPNEAQVLCQRLNHPARKTPAAETLLQEAGQSDRSAPRASIIGYITTEAEVYLEPSSGGRSPQPDSLKKPDGLKKRRIAPDRIVLDPTRSFQHFLSPTDQKA